MEILDSAYHRNGVSGEPFEVVLFKDDRDRQMVAILFDDSGYCAVLETELTNNGDIAFGSNSWRGDHFEGRLRDYLKTSKYGKGVLE
jgi:hypothetical protein